jgi:hypothetical protein
MGLFADCIRGTRVVIVAGAALVSAQSPAAARSVAAVPVPCSSLALANAITAANATSAVLRLASHCTYNLTAALPQITGDVTLVGGPNTTIKRDPAANNIRILDVAATGVLGVRGIFILNGGLSNGDGPDIRNAGTLRLNFTTVSGNLTVTGNGGGVANTGRTSIANSVIAADIILIGNGAGIDNGGDTTITTSLVNGNDLNNQGGGIFTAAGHTTRVIQSTISANTTANAPGAGLVSAGTTSLVRTLVTLNKSMQPGGGILVPAGGSVTLSQSSVLRNSPDNCSPVGSVPGCVG